MLRLYTDALRRYILCDPSAVDQTLGSCDIMTQGNASFPNGRSECYKNQIVPNGTGTASINVCACYRFLGYLSKDELRTGESCLEARCQIDGCHVRDSRSRCVVASMHVQYVFVRSLQHCP